MIQTAQLLSHWHLLTVRGALLFVLGLAALKYFALGERDLVVALLAGSAVFVLCVAALMNLFLRLQLKRRIKPEAIFDRVDAVSKTSVGAGLLLKASAVPPFFVLEVRRRFKQKGVISPVHFLKGLERHSGGRRISDEVSFPHRGVWTMDGLSFVLRDIFGLTALGWEIGLDEKIDVSPQTIAVQPVPVVASSSRSGDLVNQSSERAGDLYDIKAYDPSDGIKKILWKTYAKSGELMVRRPEPAVTPEGELAVYLVAGRHDDYVAGAFLDYLRQLEEQEIRVIFGTDGMTEPGLDAEGQELSEEWKSIGGQIRRAVNYSVWSSRCGTGADFPAFLDALIQSDRLLYQTIVFCPEYALRSGELKALAEFSSRRSVKVIFAAVPEALKQVEQKSVRLKPFPFMLSVLTPKRRREVPGSSGYDFAGAEVVFVQERITG